MDSTALQLRIARMLSTLEAPNRMILLNTGSLVATLAVTSGLGFAYWWLASRRFEAAEVGMAAAAISATGLLGAIATGGLGTLLMGTLPRRTSGRLSIVATAMLAATLSGIVLAVLFLLIWPRISIEFRPLSGSLLGAVFFSLGVGLTATSLVLDQALIGLLRGELQFGRNVLFASVKLALLALVATVWMVHGSFLVIYASWIAGIALSVLFMAGPLALGSGLPRARGLWPHWETLRGLGRVALAHHGLNLGLQTPSLALPLVVTTVLSPTMNAYFYAAWMIATFAFVGTGALTTVLYPIGAQKPEMFSKRIRLTLTLAAIWGLLASSALLLGASYFLSVFGGAYAEHAAGSLRIMGTGAFFIIAKDHYAAICRVDGHLSKGACWIGAGALIELGLASIGARIGGLDGLAIGWVTALCIETIAIGPSVAQRAGSDWMGVLHLRSRHGR